MKKIIIIGASGHGKVVIDIVEAAAEYALVGLIDAHLPIGEEVLGYKVIGRQEHLPKFIEQHGIEGGIIAIGDNFVRHRVYSEIIERCPGFAFVSAIHPRAYTGKSVSIGQGNVVMSGATINPCCTVGDFCIVNTNASLDHDSVLGNFTSLAPNVATGGNCQIGQFVAIGIGATLAHGISIGEHTVIGAGAVVLENIAARKVAYGVPAKIIKDRAVGERYL